MAWRETLRLGHPPGFKAAPPTPPLALTRPTRTAAIKANTAIDNCTRSDQPHTLITAVPTRPIVATATAVSDITADQPPATAITAMLDPIPVAGQNQVKPFAEAYPSLADVGVLCSCITPGGPNGAAIRSCQRVATRAIWTTCFTFDEGRWEPFCDLCSPHTEGMHRGCVCACPCPGCLGFNAPKTPPRQGGQAARASSPPTRRAGRA